MTKTLGHFCFEPPLRSLCFIYPFKVGLQPQLNEKCFYQFQYMWKVQELKCDQSLFLLLLFRFLHVSLLEVGSVGITLYLPFASLVLLELALLVQFCKKVFGLEGLLRLFLLKFEFLLELSVLLIQLFCSLLLSQVLFLQLSELRSRSSALRTNLEHVNALAIGR